jgi:hypothetical protein
MTRPQCAYAGCREPVYRCVTWNPALSLCREHLAAFGGVPAPVPVPPPAAEPPPDPPRQARLFEPPPRPWPDARPKASLPKRD